MMDRKLSERERTRTPDWNPYQTFVWTKTQVQALVDDNGSWAFYDGLPWSMGHKRIAPDRYEVWFYKLPN